MLSTAILLKKKQIIKTKKNIRSKTKYIETNI